jgi:hypothetical protein
MFRDWTAEEWPQQALLRHILPDDAGEIIAGWHCLPATGAPVRISSIEIQCRSCVPELQKLSCWLTCKEADGGAKRPYEDEEPHSAAHLAYPTDGPHDA